jgi:hypothetical protein
MYLKEKKNFSDILWDYLMTNIKDMAGSNLPPVQSKD